MVKTNKRKKKIRLLLVDDHPVVREGIRNSLGTQRSIEIVGEASDGREALIQAGKLNPDIVLMDISMPNMSGLEATKRLRKQAPKVKILVLTMHDNKEYVLQVTRSGAQGYVLKDIAPDELIHAIETVHRGETYFSSKISQVLLNDYVKKAGQIKKSPVTELSRREEEVLILIADGYANKEIANRLHVSVRTVETHRERIMRKLNIHSAAGLTKYSIAKGLTHI